MADETQSFDAQLRAAFDDVRYPVEDETDLAPEFPSWANARFESDGTTLTPRDVLLAVPDDYPYATADELVEAIRGGLRRAEPPD